MSVVSRSQVPIQQFYRSGPVPCPYIPGRVERKLFTRLQQPFAATVNSELTRAGFRRSHDIVYRPVCPGCAACIPVRIPVAKLELSKSQRRICRRNEDLRGQSVQAVATLEQFGLFVSYQQSRHGDSDMARMSLADYTAMTQEGRCNTGILEYRTDDGLLIGAMLFDRLDDGYSAVYSFYDPGEEKRSLGTYMIIELVRRAAQDGVPYVYLGYWIERSPKMAYKTRFRPLEYLDRDGWTEQLLVSNESQNDIS